MADRSEHHHDHGHHHHEVTPKQATSKAFIIGIVLNLAYVVAEVAGGFLTNSLALFTDAGHNFSDVVGLALSLLAIRLARVKPNATFTYGYKKTTILAALANATILLITIGILGYESILRLRHPIPVQGATVAWFAGLGVFINALSALLFFKSQHHELNARGAYLHLMADAMVTAGVVVAGIIIQYTHWYWLDAAVSLIVLMVILAGTWSLLTESVKLSLDAVPKNIDMNKVEEIIKSVKGVEHVDHIHIWAMSTTENALTAHVVLKNEMNFDERQKVVKEIKHDLSHYNINHTTLEMQSAIANGNLLCS